MKFIGVNMNDPDIEEQIVNIVNNLNDQGTSVDGVMTFWETAVPLAARVAQKLSLPGNPPSAIDAAKNKHKTRELMGRARLPTPRNRLLESETDLADAAAHVGFPVRPFFSAALSNPKQQGATTH
eukprot:2176526-Pyramimonas_sp.AAC.1